MGPGWNYSTREWGNGERVAVLIHGFMGESRQFWQVAPILAERGYRAIAVDLPGHGHSAPCSSGGLRTFAEALVDSVPSAPVLALGHSLGAMVLAAALPGLQPGCAVYVDVPFQPLGPDTSDEDASSLAESCEAAKAARTVKQLEETRPWWSDGDRRVEEEAARLFHVPTAVSLQLDAHAQPPVPPPDTDIPSLLIHADPSAFVSAKRAEELRELGFEVRGVPGAGHSVWYGFLDEFMRALDGWV